MRFYTNSHPYYCGIDLHARTLYVCIIDDKGDTLVHKEIKAKPEPLIKLIKPYIGNVIVGVECMHCWYWIADWCEDNGVDFILGHALYMKAIHGGKAKNDKIDSFKIAKLLRGGNFPVAYHYPKLMRATRDLMRRRMHITRHGAQLKAHIKNTGSQYNHPPNALNLRYPSARQQMRNRFDEPAVQASIDLDLNLVDFYHKELVKVEWHIKKHARQHRPVDFHLLKTISGIGDILALTILYEIGDISRFESVQKFASYSRLVKCKAESAALYIRNNESGKNYIAKLEKRMPKSKALSVLAHKLGRAIYYMLKNQTVFDPKKMIST